MDCKTALHMVEMCRPAGEELADAEFAEATAHIEECLNCLAQVQARRSFDTRLAAAMQSVVVPRDLKERIDARLNKAATRRRLLKLATWSAAAVVLGAAAVPFFWQRSIQTPIEIDSKSLGDLSILNAALLDHLQRVPDELEDAASARAWCSSRLKQLRCASVPPALWRSRLEAVGTTSVRERRVAVFRFQDDRGESDVFALPHESFRVTNLGKGAQLIMNTRDLVMIAWSEQGTTYVAVLKGWSAEDWRPLVSPANNLTRQAPRRAGAWPWLA